MASLIPNTPNYGGLPSVLSTYVQTPSAGDVLTARLQSIAENNIKQFENVELAKERELERAMKQTAMDRVAEESALDRAMKQQEIEANREFRNQQLSLQEKELAATAANKAAYNETLLEMKRANAAEKNAKLLADRAKAAAERDAKIGNEYAKLKDTVNSGMFSGFVGTKDDTDAINTLETLQAYGVDPNIAKSALQKAVIEGSGWLSDTTFTVDDLSKYMPPVDFDGKKIPFGEAVKLDQEGKRDLVVDPVNGRLTIK